MPIKKKKYFNPDNFFFFLRYTNINYINGTVNNYNKLSVLTRGV